ncbi:class II histocompatibility antigen, M alpha chain [Meleagris gallopavo]|uniref:MHC class II antigen M alpha chain n=1 Tax=Meleagris gallopavo TaxID=9103 RepID=B1N1D5_MELGA|nr:class II histocompatibility antigen, M alpha chain [Meleagris gallopavo]ACA64775.1 MHC class II antigen M alpha chain [Meleagris gallopavo]
MGAASGRGALVAALLGAALGSVRAEPSLHTLSEVLFCQPDTPLLGLSVAFDLEQLFSFDVPNSQWLPQLPDGPAWPAGTEQPQELQHDTILCRKLHDELTSLATGPRPMPEAKGIPVADVFLQQPLHLGYPNTLVCMVGNIFPPAITISWQRDGVPITDGVTHLTYIPMEDLGFMRFSYLAVTPHSGDIYSCIVTRERDNMSVVAYWVPQDPIPSDVLAMAVCGAVTALGILLALLGLGLLLSARRHSTWGQRGQWGHSPRTH